ncbi:MAG: hypothetical protein KKG64_00305 [Firmicutes bacterium]|nr:hypothetical protein [Bacillota bacterium]
MTMKIIGWKWIINFQNKFYPKWRTEKPALLFSTALAGEVGSICGVVTHLEGGGTNQREYSSRMVLHESVDSYIQIILLLAKYGFSAKDFEAEFKRIQEELEGRLKKKEGLK